MDENLDQNYVQLVLRLLQEQRLAVPPEQLRSILTQAHKDATVKGGKLNWQKMLHDTWVAMGFHPPRWFRKPDPSRLPMITFDPVEGWLRILARRPNGDWVMLRPDGSEAMVKKLTAKRFARLPTQKTHDPEMPARSVFKAIFHKQKGTYIEAAMATVLINTVAFAASLYSMQVYDRVIPTSGYSTLFVLCVGALLATGVEFAVKIARSHILDRAVENMDMDLSRDIVQRLLSVRVDQLPSTVGTLSGQLRGYETIRGFISQATLYAFVDAPFAIIFIIVIWLIGGPLLAAIPTVFFVLAMVTGLLYRKKIQDHATEGAQASNRKTGLLVEAVEGVETIKATGSTWRMLSNWVSTVEEAIFHDIKMRHINEKSGYITAALQQISYVGLVTAGAYEVTQGMVTMGGLIACSIISGRALAPVAMLPSLLVQWGHAKAALDGLERVYMLQSDNHGVESPLMPDVLHGDIGFDNVVFAYPDCPPASNIPSLKINRGEKVGIIGPVGAGKSTLLKLASGLYKPQRGRITLDGLDIHQIDRHSLTKSLAYLPQQSRLFMGTLRTNLLLGMPSPGDQALLEAAKITGLYNLISAHPKGLDMPIAEGGDGLSGGQKQQVALTRLLLARPKIWLLDEPTASLDESTENHIINTLMRQMTDEHTLLLVTHRPALLRMVKRLVVVTNKGVTLDGPTEQVLQQLVRQSGGGAPPQQAQQQPQQQVQPQQAQQQRIVPNIEISPNSPLVKVKTEPSNV